MNDIVEVYCAANAIEARLLVQMLKEHGINGKVVGETMPSLAGEIPTGWVASPRIWVAEPDAETARKLILKAEQKRRQEEPSLDPRGWTCPRCAAEVESGFDVCWNCLYNPAAC